MWAVTVFLVSTLMSQAPPQPVPKVIYVENVEGLAPIINGDIPQADDEALTDAKVKAVERAVGTFVEEQIMVENALPLATFVRAHTRGLVKDYVVVKPGWADTNGIRHVVINAWVLEHPLKDDLRKEVCSEETLVVDIAEYAGGEQGSTRTVENALVGRLVQDGYRVMDPGAVRRVRAQTRALPSPDWERELCLRFLSSVYISGVASAKFSQVNYGIVSANAECWVRGVDADTGEVLLATQVRNVKGFGLDEPAGEADALAKLAEPLCDAVLNALGERMRRLERTITVEVRGLRDATDQAAFANSLSALRWVSNVKAESFSAEMSIFTLSFAPKTAMLAIRVDRSPSYRVLEFTRNKIVVETERWGGSNMRKGAVLLAVCVGVATSVATAQPPAPSLGAGPIAVAAAQVVDQLLAQKKVSVLLVQGDDIYVDQGDKGGLVEGMKFDLVHPNPGLPVKDKDGKILGYVEEPVGTLIVDRVRQEMAVAHIEEKEPKRKAEKDDVGYEPVPRRTLAIVPLATVGFNATSQLGVQAADELFQQLAARGKWAVVERAQLEKVLGEQRLQLSDLMDPAKREPLGRLLGADHILLGTLAEQPSGVQANVRVLSLDKAQVVKVGSAIIPGADALALLKTPVAWPPAATPIGPTGPIRVVQGAGKVLFIQHDTDPLTNENVFKALQAAGFQVEKASKVPATLEGYRALVDMSNAGSEAAAAEAFRLFVAKGGGAVLTGYVPMMLARNKYGEFVEGGEVCRSVGFADLSPISGWFGASGLGPLVQGRYGSEERWKLRQPAVLAGTTNPMGLAPLITAGEALFSTPGRQDVPFAVKRTLTAFAQPQALLEFHEPFGEQGTHAGEVAAFSSTFGDGRVYYQSLPFDPNFPKLLELFVAGVKWAAKVQPSQ